MSLSHSVGHCSSGSRHLPSHDVTVPRWSVVSIRIHVACVHRQAQTTLAADSDYCCALKCLSAFLFCLRQRLSLSLSVCLSVSLCVYVFLCVSICTQDISKTLYTDCDVICCIDILRDKAQQVNSWEWFRSCSGSSGQLSGLGRSDVQSESEMNGSRSWMQNKQNYRVTE